MKIAIMQPAFIPPASYFRLMAASDIFVFLDSVQFDRRWFTHRQKLTNHEGEKEWLTLPIKKTDRDTTMIKDIEWADDALKKWEKRLRKFPLFDNPNENFEKVACCIAPQVVTPLRAVEIVMDMICKKLDLQPPIMKSSNMGIPENLHGKDRILYICKNLGATEYINSSGGRELYDEDEFKHHGIKLTFLPDYPNYDSILERLAYENPAAIKAEIMAHL